MQANMPSPHPLVSERRNSVNRLAWSQADKPSNGSTAEASLDVNAAQPAPIVLDIRDARLSYGRFQALNGVSLQLCAGEILGLLGPNGAGKTSLIQCLAGRRDLSSGQIECLLPGALGDIIGVVPQDIALYQDLTVLQNIAVFASLQGLPKELHQEIAMTTLEWARLEEKSKSLVKTLSGGMQRRLNIACSVLHQPKILFLDEPTVGVDPQSRESIYEMLEQLLESGTAMLLTTHHLEEAQDRCDRIAIIDEGEIVETGTFPELLAKTIGGGQHVTLRFSKAQTRIPAPLTLMADGLSAHCEVGNITTELPELLMLIHEQNLPIEDMNLRSPTLQHVFLHLTGKELRE